MNTQQIEDTGVEYIATTEKSAEENLLLFRRLYALLNKYVKSYADNNEYIYHYTNIDALVDGLIPEDATADLCFRATNVKHMNDPEEFKVDYSKIIEAVKQNEFLSSIYKNAEEKKYQFEDSFVISFSENEDDLPMWSLYGRDGKGIALAFKKDEILTSHLLIKCIYQDSQAYRDIIKLANTLFDTESTSYVKTKVFVDLNILVYPEKSTSQVIAELRKEKEEREKRQQKEESCNCDCDCAVFFNNIMSSYLLAIMPIIAYKHKAYQFENELRLLFNEADPEKIKYRTRNEIIVPYIEKTINRNTLHHIIVGPTTDINEAKRSLGQFMKARGFGEIEIKPSKVPYRKFQ